MKSGSLVSTMNVTRMGIVLVLMFFSHSALAAPAKRHKRTPAAEMTLGQALAEHNQQAAVDNLLDSLLSIIQKTGDLPENNQYLSKRSASDTILTEMLSDLSNNVARDITAQFLLDKAASGDFKRNFNDKRTATSVIKDSYISQRNREKTREALRKQFLEGSFSGASKRSVSDTFADTLQKQIFQQHQATAFLDQLLAVIAEGGDIKDPSGLSVAKTIQDSEDKGSGFSQ